LQIVDHGVNRHGPDVVFCVVPPLFAICEQTVAFHICWSPEKDYLALGVVLHGIGGDVIVGCGNLNVVFEKYQILSGVIGASPAFQGVFLVDNPATVGVVGNFGLQVVCAVVGI
jgi:hypothetical protein